MMRSLSIALCATISFVPRSLGVSLNVCDLGNSGGSLQISSQNDITTKLNGCTTIIGDISISSNYTGSLELPGVTNISGYLEIYEPGTINVPAPYLTSVSLGDLLYIESLVLDGANLLQALLLPKLETIEYLSLAPSSPLALSLPFVTNCTYLSLLGNFTSISMPALSNVSSSLLLNTVGADLCCAIPSIGSPVAIDFPSLVYGQSITFEGNISSVSMPVLALAGDLNIESNGEVNLPLLRNTTSKLSISGEFLSVSLPSLIGVGSDFMIEGDDEATVPLEINISKLENATSITIHGFLADFNLPSLEYLTGDLFITSWNSNFNCTPFNSTWSHVAYDSTGTFVCHVISTPTHGISKKTQLEIGLGVSIPCALIIICLGIFWRWRVWASHQPQKSIGLPLQPWGDPK